MLQEKKYLDTSLTVEERVEALMSHMSVEEKIGQLNQVWGLEQMGTPDPRPLLEKGLVGSMLYVLDVKTKNEFQRIAMEQSPSGIPILFGSDVVHGYQTGFPIPLALASSWDPKVLEETQHIAASEARADGVSWTFFPNADIARDARWGRVTETMGEDPYLSSALVTAQVHGFQGEDKISLNGKDRLLACAKHFAGYGAAVGGRDYAPVFLPEAELRNVYLPPFKAALEAGVGTFMTAYMDLNNVPATASKYLLRQVLREEWKFDGYVVTDAGTVGSLVTQGFARDRKDAAYRAFKAGANMDMGSYAYLENLGQLLQEGKILESEIDEMVRPIVEAKIRLGLFEQPYVTEGALEEVVSRPEHREKARWAAARSMVLLKNEDNLLPLSKEIKKVAVIGPLADAIDATEGIVGLLNVPQAVTVLQGIKNKLPESEVTYAPGPWIKRDISSVISEFVPDFCGKKLKRNQTDEEADHALKTAIEIALEADVVVMVLGEADDMSSEGGSRSCLDLPGRQEELLKAVVATGKPVVLVLLGGRPLSVAWAAENVPAILEAWQPGWEGGNAVADILFGDRNPGGKLPITFPRSAGQAPTYYGENLTHAPVEAQPTPYSRYWNETGTPLFPFGYGLSYSNFTIENIRLSTSEIKVGDSVNVSVDVTNTSEREGDEVVQLYIHQRYGSDSRPKRLLKGFERITLKSGATRAVLFTLGASELSYWSSSARQVVQDATIFDIWVGANSTAALHTELEVKK